MKAETIRQRSFNRINSSIGLIQLGRSGSDDTLMEEQYCIKEMQELHGYLDMVKEMIRPGCSQEMLQVALNSLAFLFDILTSMSSTPRPLASL
ncbi:pyrophosphate--fructose 6-phosphate 1-phosphotransferase subunit alpha isoform X1 [Manihot esculenta]|uniref:Uncharacterized protein n=1 Tax=Manihot esculenta TaxID=3983 RepID=A0A2C9VGB6_MANES|nr:pyrophosphate--fructose 6-phosphate 1-phosphotransferase subunit alpha isoform X1 [Manihot esculenta]OAY43397.1 hypothetical protein MANES_08G067100v8 [Manihot esculenta]